MLFAEQFGSAGEQLGPGLIQGNAYVQPHPFF